MLNTIKRACFWILKCCYFIKKVLYTKKKKKTKKPSSSYLRRLQTFDGNTCSESVGHLGAGKGI